MRNLTRNFSPYRSFAPGVYSNESTVLRRSMNGCVQAPELMKTRFFLFLFATTLFFPSTSRAQRRPDKLVPPGLEAQVKQFFTDKMEQARALAKEEKQEQMPEVWDFFM